MSDDELLEERLATSPEPRKSGMALREVPATPAPSRRTQDLDLCQWQVSPNGVFRPAAKTIAILEPGAYMTGHDEFGPFLKAQPLLSDEIVELPDSANVRVLASIQKFWKSRDKYVAHGLLFKRGVVLWGPPGSGKTVAIHLLTKDLISNGGIVIFCVEPGLTILLLTAVRRIEPERPLIVVMEDVDEIIDHHGEHDILAMLDGEHQTDNVVSVASTNYPEKLGARILNRPSRFDERIHIGMPSSASRATYLKKVANGGKFLDDSAVRKWTQDTDGFSIAHLRELVAAVLCLDQDYDSVIARLRAMHKRPKEVDGFARNSPGFEEHPF